jgi:starch synthase
MPDLRVLHVAAECAPLAKVGGLGDVVGALPAALAAEGVEASVVMPLYGGPDGPVAQRAGDLALVADGHVGLGDERLPYRVWRSDGLGLPVYLVDEPAHFGDAGVYFRSADGMPFAHGAARFVVFQLAVLDWLGSGAAPPADVLHLHDNHAALVPAMQRYGPADAAVRALPTVFTVHSADHQGEVPLALWERLGLRVPDADAPVVGGEVNAMRLAVEMADAVTTVSPSYAEELASDDDVAGGLAGAFRAAGPRFTGVLNGIDPAVWDPETDPYLAHTYSARDLEGKAATKAAVCAELNLDAARPLAAFVGRLMPEKGVEILLPGVDQIVRGAGAAVVLLGTGDPEHEAEVRGLAGMLTRDGFSDRFAAVVAFDEGMAHRLYAAADLFLMPSRSEPCGLGQLYAMAYGTPPVVHAVGGLRDTVRPFDGEAGTGFPFDDFTSEALVAAVRAALAVYADGPAWRRLQGNALAEDFSWSRSARAYAALYRRVASRP